MKIVRYQSATGGRYGILDAEGIVHEMAGSPFDSPKAGAAVGNVAGLTLLPPIEPPTIFCIGLNYKLHIQETNAKTPEFPLSFIKPRTTLVGLNAPIVYPKISQMVHYEGELAVVIGRAGRHIPESRALDYVLGYTCGNDVSARDWQRRESANGFLVRGKGFDTFCPLGPAIVTDIDGSDLRLETRLNGEVKQSTRTSDLLFSVPQLIAFVSDAITLEAGDVIMTGTPSGVGPIAPGDVVEIEIEKIGVLRNPVVAEA